MNDDQLIDRARGLRNVGLSYRDIGLQMNVSHTTIRAWLHRDEQWTVAGRKSLLEKHESLTGVFIGGTVHARYPTGQQTLCGLTAPDHELNHFIPDCGACSRMARIWDRVDGSMPDHWRPEHQEAA